MAAYETANMEKQPLLSSSSPSGSCPSGEPSIRMRNESRLKRLVCTMFAIATVTFFSFTLLYLDSWNADDATEPPFSYSKKVPLEVHAMSKCPDFRDCLHDLILPTMLEVEDLVDFRLSFIGSETDRDDGVLCKHGPSECVGNVLELCVAGLYPTKQSLGFIMCLSRDFEEIPEKSLVEDCALEHAISMQEINDCAVDDDGVFLVEKLKQSFRHSQAVNVSTSCTVRLDNEIRCVRDGGEWRDCEDGHDAKDLVKNIRKLAS